MITATSIAGNSSTSEESLKFMVIVFDTKDKDHRDRVHYMNESISTHHLNWLLLAAEAHSERRLLTGLATAALTA